MTQWKKLLKSLGFSDSESAIYLTSLEMGPASVQDIAKKAGVSRVTTYAVIESLSGQGLMSSVEKGKKRLFVAESPERVVSFLQTKMKEMEATLKEVESSINDLKLLQRGEKPVVRLFEGPEALKAIQDDVLRSKPTQMDEFGNLDELRKMYPAEYMQPFFTELNKIRPKSRSIFFAKNYQPKARTSEDEIIILPEDAQFFGDIFVYGNKIALSTLTGKLISVLIESQVLADTLRSMFNLAWKKNSQK